MKFLFPRRGRDLRMLHAVLPPDGNYALARPEFRQLFQLEIRQIGRCANRFPVLTIRKGVQDLYGGIRHDCLGQQACPLVAQN